MRRFALLSVWVGSVVVAQACGGTTDTDDGGLDGSTDDVTTTQDNFVPPADTGPDDVVVPDDTGTGDGGTDAIAIDAGPDSGGKPITSWTCGNTTVSDCSQCIGHTQTCVYCANADASVVSGTCVQFGTGCGNTVPNGFDLCTCPRTDGGVGVCPEPYLVCLPVSQNPQNPGVCDTCGAVTTTNGLACQGGGKCSADSGACN